MSTARTVEEALEVLRFGGVVECVKVRKTAEHCLDTVKSAICSSANEVHNFFNGKLPDERKRKRVEYYDTVRNTGRIANSGPISAHEMKKTK